MSIMSYSTAWMRGFRLWKRPQLKLDAVQQKFGKYEVITASGIVSSQRPVPADIIKPPYARSPPLPPRDLMKHKPLIHNEKDINCMRVACKTAAEILQFAGSLLRPGLTTEELDRLVHEAILAKKCYPSPLLYMGFPKSCCTSVNNVACHGIPDSRPLADGDIINIDISIFHGSGFHGDCSQTFLVGNVDLQGSALVNATLACLTQAIKICGPNQKISAIGAVVEDLANSKGFSICNKFIGHGIGRDFHHGPQVFHTRNNSSIFMQPGMIFTIEPILNQGSGEVTEWDDGWTNVTVDGGRSAQWEHTVLITEDGVEVLTEI